MELTPGASLGPYKIERTLGSGAMGAVYLAYDERLDRHVALKMLTESAGAAAQQRLRREARAIARLNHPNIAALYDVVEQGDIAVLVMEYVDGEPLSALVKTGRLTPARTIDIGLQLTDALAYAHREGIIHRDIKPANVMLTHEGKVKVLDLGIARIAAADSSAETRDHTETAIGAGTPAYMAPERLRSHPADVRTDIYSVGVLLFELVTGRRPYDASDAISLSVAMGTTPPPRVSTFSPDVPRPLDDVIARAMAVDRKARYESATELHDALVQVRSGGAVEPFVAPGPVPRPRPWRGWLVAAGAVLIALVAIAWTLFKQTPEPAAAVVPPTLAIPPVVTESADRPDLDELGVLLQSVLALDLGGFPGITVVAAGPPTPQNAAAAQPPAAGFTTSIALRDAMPGVIADVNLLKLGKNVSHKQFRGEPIEVMRLATDYLASGLEQNFRPGRALTATERGTLRRQPTTDGEALKQYLRGRTLLDLSETNETDDQAIEAFQNAIRRDGSFAFAHAGVSQASFSRTKRPKTDADKSAWIERAREAATRAAQIDLNCDQAHLAMSLVHTADKKKDAAVEEAKQALTLTPDSDDAHRVLGAALVDAGQRDAGIAALHSAIDLRPKHWINYYALGRNYLLSSRYEESIEPLSTVVNHLPNFESSYVNLGYAHTQLGHWDLAVGYLTNALLLNKTDHFALNNLATAYYWNNQFPNALESYKAAVGEDPESPKLQMNLGDVYEALQRNTDAKRAYAQAVKLADAKRPPDSGTEAIAAKCMAKVGQPGAEERALAAYTKAQNDKDVVSKVAVVYALHQKTDEAIRYLGLALKAGYPRFLAQAEPDFKSIRNEPGFKKLLESGR